MNIFYTPEIEGDTHTLSEQESKHCIRVLRRNTGDILTLVDGRGGFYKAEITNANPKKCLVKIQEKTTEFDKRNYRLHVAIAPTKNNERLEWFLEKATEIGIDEITPLLCDHSERKQIKIERLDKVVVSAMKQSLKAYKPKLNNLTNFDAFLEHTTEQVKFIAHCEEGDKKYLFNSIHPQDDVLILIGPEGDFSNEEIEKAIDKGFKPISLGSSRLRTETAGVVATQILNIVNEK